VVSTGSEPRTLTDRVTIYLCVVTYFAYVRQAGGITHKDTAEPYRKRVPVRGRRQASSRSAANPIRRRVAAGVDDFAHLVEYPDDQLEAAFDSYDDEHLVRALADMQVVSERVRLLHGIERDVVLRRARTRTQTGERGERPVPDLEFRTDEEIRSAVRAELESEYAPDDWKRRSELALKIGSLLALPGVSPDPVRGGPLGDRWSARVRCAVLRRTPAGVWVGNHPAPEYSRRSPPRIASLR